VYKHNQKKAMKKQSKKQPTCCGEPMKAPPNIATKTLSCWKCGEISNFVKKTKQKKP
jgi:hypothetical protein